MEDWQHGGFGLYIHWPFCQSKCPYCDFNSHVSASIDHTRWGKAYLSEIRRLGAETPGRILQTIYFGGGTPSLMRPETVGAIISTIRATWPMVNEPEITLEANPSSIDSVKFQGFKDAGVNRVSMGMQAMNDADLRRLGRAHTVSEALRAYDIARKTFGRVNFDLIYARQNQSLDDWRQELKTALSLSPDHLSLYQLTIEEGTVFAARNLAGKLRGLPDEDLAADMFDLTQEVTAAAGLPAYEVSNHAANGTESRHNLIYWRGGDYIGIGPGAHGRLTIGSQRFATETHRTPLTWLESVETKGQGGLVREPLSGNGRALEYLMMSIRLSEGLSLTRLNSMDPTALRTDEVSTLEELGLIQVQNDTLKATMAGRLVLNQVIRKLAGA